MNKMFEKDARVLFVGDSIITNGRFVAKIFDYYKTNFPSLNVRIYNKGVPGDNAGGMVRRFVDDIMDTEATEIVLMAGMNDIYRDLYAEENPTEENLERRKRAKDAHCENMIKLAELFYEKGLPITLCSSTPYDEITDVPAKNLRGCDDALCEIFARDCENLKKYNLKNTVDFITPMKEIIDGLAEKGAPSIVGGDRVHPTAIGHEVMARLFLIDQGINVTHPTVKSVIDGTVSLPDFTEDNAERYAYEQKLRSIAFVDYHLAWDRNAYPTIEEKIKFWEDNMDEKYPDHAGYTYLQIKKYLDEKKKEPFYKEKLTEYTEKMVVGEK
jgi:lysophospholipase L1-like esterase